MRNSTRKQDTAPSIPCGFYVHEKQASNAIVGGIVIESSRLDDGSNSTLSSLQCVSKRVVFASSQTLKMATLIESLTVDTDGIEHVSWKVDLERARSQQLPDVVLGLWRFEPPQRSETDVPLDLQPVPEDRFHFQQTRRVATQLVNHQTYDWRDVSCGFLMLTERYDLILFVVNESSGAFKSVSKLSLHRPHHKPAMRSPLLTIDPVYRVILLHLYEAELEYIPLDLRHPFKLRHSHTIRVNENHLVALHFMSVASDMSRGALKDKRKRKESPLNPHAKSARRRINGSGSNAISEAAESAEGAEYAKTSSVGDGALPLKQPDAIPSPRLCVLYIRDPRWTHLHRGPATTGEDDPAFGIWMRVVEFSNLSILELSQHKCLPPMRLQATRDAAIVESQLEPGLLLISSQDTLQAVKVSWQTPNYYKSVITEVMPPLAEIHAITHLSDTTWILGDLNGSVRLMSYQDAVSPSDPLEIPIKLSMINLGTFSAPTGILKIGATDKRCNLWLTSQLGSSQSLVLEKVSDEYSLKVVDAIEHLSPAVDFIWNPLCVAGGWQHEGGIKLIQDGVQYTNLVDLLKGEFTHVFPISVEVDNLFVLALLSRETESSVLLVAEGSATGQQVCLRVVTQETSEAASLGVWDLLCPTLCVARWGSIFAQVTTGGVRSFASNISLHYVTQQSTVACVDHSCGTQAVLIYSTETSVLRRIIIQASGQLEEAQSMSINYRVAFMSSTEDFVGLVKTDLTSVILLSPSLTSALYTLSLAGQSLLHGPSMTFKGLELITDFALIDWPMTTIPQDIRTIVVALATSVGDLLTLELPVISIPSQTPPGSLFERRPFGTNAVGSLIPLSRQQVLVLGERSLFLTRDASGILRAVAANLPSSLETLAVLDWPALVPHFQKRDTEHFCLLVSGEGERTLSFGVLDANWHDCKVQQTFTGFTIEHIAYHTSRKLVIAAGLRVGQSPYTLEELKPSETANHGMVLCLRPSRSGREPLEIAACYRLGADEIPTALNCVKLQNQEFVALGTTMEREDSSDGCVRLLTVSSEPGSGDSEPCSLDVYASVTLTDSVQCICVFKGFLVVGTGCTIKVFDIRKQEFSLMSTHVSYNHVQDVQPLRNYLLVADLLRSIGLVELTLSPGGAIMSANEMARDHNSLVTCAVGAFSDTTFAVCDDNKNFWFLQRTMNENLLHRPTIESLNTVGWFRLGEQVNRMKTVQLNKDSILGAHQSQWKLFSLFAKDSDSVNAVAWLTCEGSMGVVIPIMDEDVMNNFRLLLRAIHSTVPAIAGLSLETQRDLFLDGRNMEVKNAVDGILIKQLLRSHIGVQKKVYNKLIQLQAEEQGNAFKEVSFEDFRIELEGLNVVY
eukprot:Blabericola_migrator_1__11540@NODE_68_length_15625_cov_137_110426_g61_i0_p1_GENE_NODE_68_length_15625_cov_137_110426_g61_i0NODE_68_length_15625_cov_137_110426_g61_i0_p1_ORF_typecomplete_len1358_score247_04CPSF_A/PF03178_15/22CPSF_A/PF03178_15/1_2e41MMS1_N/PF10433_9/1_6e20MMS1_N/PF10433_9/2_5e03MMS1_N/PF10433_9/2_1e03_NODE_68_length_15625_cov_137_110426_g61_i019215994